MFLVCVCVCVCVCPSAPVGFCLRRSSSLGVCLSVFVSVCIFLCLRCSVAVCLGLRLSVFAVVLFASVRVVFLGACLCALCLSSVSDSRFLLLYVSACAFVSGLCFSVFSASVCVGLRL